MSALSEYWDDLDAAMSPLTSWLTEHDENDDDDDDLEVTR